jgi:hypothetical protein
MSVSTGLACREAEEKNLQSFNTIAGKIHANSGVICKKELKTIAQERNLLRVCKPGVSECD